MKQRSPIRLVLENLEKTYPNGTTAVSGVSLTIEPGTVFGLVGPNGAGKSTLMKLAAGLLRPKSGRVLCGEKDVTGSPEAAARFMVLMPDPLGVYTDITCRQYLEFFARASGEDEALSRIPEAIEQLELAPWLDEEVETLSAGWQRRLALARVILADPPILLLDEPAAGLDVSARVELLSFVRRLADGQRTMMISSHILPELEQLADRFGLMNAGCWVPFKPGTNFFDRHDLLHGLGKPRWILRCDDPARAASLADGDGVLAKVTGAEVEIEAKDEHAASRALGRVVAGGVGVREFISAQSDLTAVVLEKLGVKGGSS